MQYRRSLETVYTENNFNDTSTFIFQKANISPHNNFFPLDGTKTEELELPDEYEGDFPNETTLDFEFHK